MTWSDGKPFTVDDVVFTLNLIKKFPTLDLKGAWQHIASLETKGDHLVIHLKEDDAPAQDIISQTLIVPEHIWKDQKSPDTWRRPEPGRHRPVHSRASPRSSTRWTSTVTTGRSTRSR